MATAKAVMVCPEGKENWSGGRRVAQQWGWMADGRLLLKTRFRLMKSPIPLPKPTAAEAIASKRWAPPKIAMMRPMAYQSQPSPPRVAQIIQTRIQRGARQAFTRRIRL